MKNSRLLTILLVAGLVPLSAAAYGETPSDSAVASPSASNAESTADRTTELAKIRVTANDGTVFYNQYVPLTALPEVELEAETVDSYTVEYEGRVYVNRVMKDMSQ